MSEHDKKTVKIITHKNAPMGFGFFVAYIGAAVYFVEISGGGFWQVILALLKAAVWPAFLVYHVLKLLGA